MITVPKEAVELVAERIEGKWRAGTIDTFEFVMVAHRTLLETVTGYHGSLLTGYGADYRAEDVAAAMRDEQTSGRLHTPRKMAEWLIGELFG